MREKGRRKEREEKEEDRESSGEGGGGREREGGGREEREREGRGRKDGGQGGGGGGEGEGKEGRGEEEKQASSSPSLRDSSNGWPPSVPLANTVTQSISNQVSAAPSQVGRVKTGRPERRRRAGQILSSLDTFQLGRHRVAFYSISGSGS